MWKNLTKESFKFLHINLFSSMEILMMPCCVTQERFEAVKQIKTLFEVLNDLNLRDVD